MREIEVLIGYESLGRELKERKTLTDRSQPADYLTYQLIFRLLRLSSQ